MSWETLETEQPCFCGKGKLVQISSSNDSGSSEYHEVLQCNDCTKKYVYAQVRERPDRPLGWILREAFDRLEEEREAARREREEATAKARMQYGDALIRVLAPARSRQQIWERLRLGSVRNPELGSFAAFNRAVRERG